MIIVVVVVVVDVVFIQEWIVAGLTLLVHSTAVQYGSR